MLDKSGNPPSISWSSLAALIIEASREHLLISNKEKIDCWISIAASPVVTPGSGNKKSLEMARVDRSDEVGRFGMERFECVGLLKSTCYGHLFTSISLTSPDQVRLHQILFSS